MADLLKPPRWLVVLTAAFTLVILMMAVAETTLWTHYLIDQGEYVSIAGVVFILAAGLYLHKQSRLLVSLPLTAPWLVYPVVTQGDQIIDNLTINQMRLVVHVILAVLFAAPLVVLCMAARQFLGLQRRGLLRLASVFLAVEFWIAYEYLGLLMILTLALMSLAAGLWIAKTKSIDHAPVWFGPGATNLNRAALGALIAGVVLSLGLYFGFKNRPGAYQGSPHFFHDPAQADAAYPLWRIEVPRGPFVVRVPELAAQVRSIFETYGEALEALSRGYYILDRNYNYAFHNALFLRKTPLLPNYRRAGLSEIRNAEQFAREAGVRFNGLRPALQGEPGLIAVLEEADGYVAYALRRAAMLEEMTARWEKTQAGLQHVTHVYEGEGKVLGVVARQIIEKHRAILSAPEIESMANPLVASSEKVFQAYANRIIGF